MKEVIIYTKTKCPLCDEAKQVLTIVQEQIPFNLTEVDIYQDDYLLEKYQLMIPVVQIDGKEIDYGQVDLDKVWKALE